MIYLVHLQLAPNGDILAVELSACEDEPHAQARERRGFIRCTPEAFREYWRLRDTVQLRELYPAPASRAVGENIVYPTQPWWDKGTKR